MRDLLGIDEAAYADAPDHASWGARKLEACGRLDEGLGVILGLTAASDAGLDCSELVGTSTPPTIDAFRRAGSPGRITEALDSTRSESKTSLSANFRFLAAASRSDLISPYGTWNGATEATESKLCG